MKVWIKENLLNLSSVLQEETSSTHKAKGKKFEKEFLKNTF